MKKFSRVIALILSVMMLIGMLPTGVFAAEDEAVVAPVAGGSNFIDFTDPAAADEFEVINKKNAEIVEGTGLTLTATRPAFEDCKGQNSGAQATTPEDVIAVPVSGDFEATLEFVFATGGARNGYYQFFGFYASEGDDYQNMAGIRGGDGAMQNFLRVDGAITADSSNLNSRPGLASAGTYWYKIVKEGDTYTCQRSADGEEFTDMFVYEGTGIEADKLIIDAYTGMTEGYQFTLKSLEIISNGAGCEHDFNETVIEPTCTAEGYTELVCSNCGKTKKTNKVAALGHDWDEGTVIVEATETTAGVIEYACTRCDATKTQKTAPTKLVPGPTVVKDPESPTGYTVQFVYYNETARQVNFACDCGLKNELDRTDTKQYTPWEYKPGLMRSGGFTAPMEEIADGYWYYELPLAAGANQYWFQVNGNTDYMVPDPANAPYWSPNSAANKNAYNVVYVPYDEKQAYEPLRLRAEAENPKNGSDRLIPPNYEDADKYEMGTWWYEPVEIGNRTHYMGVYLPYGYDADRAEPYKTIYILHGGGQDESDWVGMGSVQNILDNLIAEGRTEPAVLIAPTSNNNMIGGTGDNYANLFNVIIPYVEEHWNVSTDKMDRSFAGLSMGSMNTQNIINSNPVDADGNPVDKFGYYGPWSGGCSVSATAPGIEYAHILFAGGYDDFGNPSEATVNNLKNQGVYCLYKGVSGAHDFSTWCQMFRIYCDEYLWKPAAFGDFTEPEGVQPIDFTDPASADRFTVEAQDVTEIREGQGLYLVSTKDAFEPCNGQIKTFEPKDVVMIPVEGDWNLTFKVKFNTGGSRGAYDFFGIYAMEDYDNCVGIRCGNTAIQNFLRQEGTVTADTNGIKTRQGLSSYNNATLYFRLVKEGDDYTCYWSTDGGFTFTRLFDGLYVDTGIDAQYICLDAYSGSNVGYNYLVQSMTTAPCQHETDPSVVEDTRIEPTCTVAGTLGQVCTICGATKGTTLPATGHTPAEEAVVTAPTCTEAGYTTYTCTVCGETYTGSNVAALGHTWDEGVVTLEPTEDDFGTMLYTCTVCGETKEGKILPTNLKLGPTVVKDENSITGYTAKFVYYNETATRVDFKGDIGLKNDIDRTDRTNYTPFEYRPGLMRGCSFSAPMENLGNGYWYYEVPLAGGANQYWFTVNGGSRMMPDPANAPEWSPRSNKNSKNAYNILYVPYDEEKQNYEPLRLRAEAENPRDGGYLPISIEERKDPEIRDKYQVGEWDYYEIEYSTGRKHWAGIYTPYGYDPDRAEPYKLIFAQHGSGQDESDWMGIGSVQNIMDNLVAEGRCEPAVIVSPTYDNNMLNNNDNYATVINELVGWMIEHYNVSADPMDRAFCGLSAGGGQTISIINSNPKTAEGESIAKFGYYGPWSAGMNVNTNAPGIDYAHIFIGTGWNDTTVRPNDAAFPPLKEAGLYCDYAVVTGAHDFNAWNQLFRMFCEDYLWKPAAFGDTLGVELGATVVEDPESPTGYTGKFLYFNDEVDSVTFCGDLMLSYTDDPGRNAKLYSPFDYKPGMMRRGGTAFQAPMVDLGGGYWYYELPLTAGANQYWFNLPGSSRMQPDPANHPQWSPASNWNTKNAYNAIYVPYADVQDNEVLAARVIENPREGQNNGTWSYVPYKLSEEQADDYYMGVYLPYGYDADREEPYKTIYVLHGGGQDESDWLGIGSVQNIIDNLYADGRIEDAPVLIVPRNTRLGAGNLEATFAFVEKNYNVSTDRMDRAICGLSMGGMMINSLLNDDKKRDGATFGYYGFFSGGNPSNALTSPYLLDSCYYVGSGLYEGNPYNQALVNTGASYHFTQFAGAHDFNTWCQMFTDFVDNYAFQPDNFERKLFDDVDADAYYYDAVKWAVDNGITNGFEPGIFAPDNTVTRAQIVTMLWRAAGCPAASAPATFKDVKADQYYAEAVAWAVENGITNGMGKNMFAPNDTCTRGQIVTFLWRYMGKPAAEAAAEFTDVPAGEYYADAVAWAVEAGVTTGYNDGTFKPAADCTRAQAVTFLMRALAD